MVRTPNVHAVVFGESQYEWLSAYLKGHEDEPNSVSELIRMFMDEYRRISEIEDSEEEAA
jgi:hypothetical protein